MKTVTEGSPRFSGSGVAFLVVAGCVALAGCRSSSSGSGGGGGGGSPKYKIGGTVTGLAGSGLTLQSNLGDVLSVAADGPFAFPTEAAEGTAYAVTVSQQPGSPWQTCAVTGGAGTVGGADVASVLVTCTTNAYAVGGTVTGLSGGTLVLQNGGEDLTISADGTFAFTTPVLSGASYAVTVVSKPASQTCAVANGSGMVGGSAVTTLVVTCSTGAVSVIQRWQAPTVWGQLWADDPAMVEHAHFDGTSIVETKGVSWTIANGSLPPQRELGAFPGGSRWGAGPFAGPRYQATGGDSGFDFPTDMLVCAVVKPDYDPVVDGGEHVIIGKGIQDQAGWVLLQKHHMFNFYYRYDDGLGNNFTGNAYTPTYFADESLPDNGPLNPSYLVVCGGRDGDTLVSSVNSFPDAAVYPETLPAGTQLHVGSTPHPLTIGGYDDNDVNHVFGGRVYETAIWAEPATAANIQAKFDAVLGLPAGARYTRNREGPFIGPDGQYHTAWRHAPRAYLPDATSGFGGGFLFGLQAWNRLTAPYTPPTFDVASQINPVIAYGEALDLWTPSGTAAVLKDQLAPPGDSERNGAERVTLAAGDGISTPLGFFDSAGPIHGMAWIRPVSTTGTLRVSTTQPASGASQHDIDLSTLPAGQWTRVWLTGLTNDGSQTTPATLSFTNAGSSPIDFYAWGVDLTQIGGGGDLGSFDPGMEMYDWTGTANKDAYPIDVLQLPAVPSSTAATGFCLSVEAQPPAGLSWTAPFVADRSPLTWVSDVNGTDVVNIFMSGTTHSYGQKLCGWVSTASTAVCWVPTWGPGTQHTITLCAAPTGAVTLYADGAQVGMPVMGSPPFDLATGHVIVGSNSPAKAASNIAGWQGFVTKVAVCPASAAAACQ